MSRKKTLASSGAFVSKDLKTGTTNLIPVVETVSVPPVSVSKAKEIEGDGVNEGKRGLNEEEEVKVNKRMRHRTVDPSAKIPIKSAVNSNSEDPLQNRSRKLKLKEKKMVRK